MSLFTDSPFQVRVLRTTAFRMISEDNNQGEVNDSTAFVCG